MNEKRASDGYVGFGGSSHEEPRIQGWEYTSDKNQESDDPGGHVYAYHGYYRPWPSIFMLVAFIAAIGAFVRWHSGKDTAAAADRPPISAPAQR